jgi:hypothetical protein
VQTHSVRVGHIEKVAARLIVSRADYSRPTGPSGAVTAWLRHGFPPLFDYGLSLSYERGKHNPTK